MLSSPEKRSCSAPPDNRNVDERCDNGVTNRSNSVDRKSKHGKLFTVEIHFLDESKTVFQINQKSLSKLLFNQVCQTLNLIEIDYFGLQYFDANETMYWLDLEKPLYRQLSLDFSNNITMYFAVKFYCSDPSRLEDELTRYLFSLQIKRDLSRGELHCNENTAALMASFIIQAECGDFNLEEYVDHSYVSRFKLIPNQDEEFEWRVMENHKKHIGQSPSEADYNLLETARRCEMYGIKLTAVKDHEGVPLNLSVAHHGVVVFQNQTKVNTFSWAKIRKLSFKRKRFLIKLHQEEYFGDVVEFIFDARNECKNFWKKCIEQHSFFRCVEVKHNPKQKTKIFSRGSSFRYSGRTQQQVVEYVRHTCIKREPFQRSNSLRHNSITERSQNVDGSSISIQPLFPVSSEVLNRNNKDQNSKETFEEERPKSAQETATVMHKESIFSDTPPSPSVKERPPDLSNLTLNLNEPSINNLWNTDRMQSANVINSSLQAKSKALLVNSQNRKMSFTSETDQRRSRHRLEKEYHVFRELVMSERTYKKDIELINTWFKDDVSKENSRPTEMLSLLFSATEPLLEIHNEFLEQIELLLLIWEGKSLVEYNRSIGDVLSDIISWLPLYERLIERLPFILERINASFRHNRDFERACRDFESRKGCYLPYTSFILKPAFHITHYCHIFEKLLNHYASNNPEYGKCKYVVEQLKQFNGEYAQTLNSLINLVILIELQRDITGMDNIVQSGRTFVREGCLLKLSKKGYQQRLFFLFSDILIYASRSASAQFQFKVHGHLPLQNIMVEETEPKLGINYCFTIYGGDRALMVAANSDEERHIWMQDLSEATFKLSHINGELLPFFPTVMSSNELLDKIDNALSQRWIQKSDSHVTQMENFDKLQSRSNTMAHVCWHRNCSISSDDYKHALTSCLSGYLLRKFKNSSGWQKLWVVFTHFCLFFYKSHQDDFPLASLPLLGYTLSMPSDNDNINKNYVFKLQFKTHVYFFRTESEYTFTQWMDVIKNSTMKSISFNDNI